MRTKSLTCWTIVELKKELGLSQPTLRKHLLKSGLKPISREAVYPPETLQMLCSMKKLKKRLTTKLKEPSNCWTIPELSLELGLSTTTIRHYIFFLDIKATSRGNLYPKETLDIIKDLPKIKSIGRPKGHCFGNDKGRKAGTKNISLGTKNKLTTNSTEKKPRKKRTLPSVPRDRTTIAEIAEKLGIQQDVARRRLRQYAIKPLEYVGTTGFYDLSATDAISNFRKQGRPFKSKQD